MKQYMWEYAIIVCWLLALVIVALNFPVLGILGAWWTFWLYVELV